MGFNSPHYVGNTWPVMRVVITETQGSSAVETWAWALRLAVEVMLERVSSSAFGCCGGVKTRASNSVFSHCRDIRRVPQASRLRCGLQTLCLSTEVVLRCGLRTLRLGIRGMLGNRIQIPRLGIARVALISLALWILFYYLMTYFQQFLDSLQNPLQSFQSSTVDWDGFRNTLDFFVGRNLSRLDWQSSKIPGAWSCLDLGLRECTAKLFEATGDDHRECRNTESRPHRCSELVVSVMLNQENLLTAFVSVLLN